MVIFHSYVSLPEGKSADLAPISPSTSPHIGIFTAISRLLHRQYSVFKSDLVYHWFPIAFLSPSHDPALAICHTFPQKSKRVSLVWRYARSPHPSIDRLRDDPSAWRLRRPCGPTSWRPPGEEALAAGSPGGTSHWCLIRSICFMHLYA